MIRFVTDEGMHLRIACSALWECVCSIRVMRDPARHTPLRPWLRRLSGTRAADVRMLAALVRADGGYIPDFLAPPPAAPNLTFGAELARLRATPADVVRQEVARAARGPAGAPAAQVLAEFGGDTQGLRDAVADALERYWAAGIAPEWARLEAVLEGEVLGRARELALMGPEAMLGALHPAIAFCERTVEVRSPQEDEVRLGTRELLLVPSVFAWPDVFTVHDPAWRASIYYPARGVGTLWDDHESTHDRLGLLLGRSRARILRALTRPACTGELAARMGAAPASVSAHVRRLHKGGFLDRTRIGRHVFYQTSTTGRAILAAVDEPG